MAARPILLLTLACAVTAAHASPRTDPTVGRSVFTGAATPHASSITLNPAALGLASVGEVYLAATSLVDATTIDRRIIDPDTGRLAPGERVAGTELGFGGMLGVVLRPGTRYAVSFELRTPPPEIFPSNHGALRYHTLGGRQRNYLATIGSTIKITSKLYFGASLSHDNTFLELRYARDTAAAEGEGPRGTTSDCDGVPCGFEHPAATEIYDVAARSAYVATENLKVNIGVLANVYRNVWVGVAYHTPPGFNIQTELEGTTHITRAPRDGGGALRGGSTIDVSFPASVDAEVKVRLPQLLELHIAGRWEDLSRFQAYDVRPHGSTFVPNGVPEWMLRPRGMHDSFALWGGVEQIDFGQRARFGGRLGLETSSVDDDRTSPVTIGPTSLTADIGGQLRLDPNWIVELAYGLQYFPAVDVEASAFDPRFQRDCIASEYDYSTPACRSVRDGYAIPTAAGEYGRVQHALRLGLRYDIP